MSERDAASDLEHAIDASGRLAAWIRDFGHLKERPFIADLQAVIDSHERLRGENDRLGAKVVGLEMRIHGLQSALAIWRDDDDE